MTRWQKGGGSILIKPVTTAEHRKRSQQDREQNCRHLLLIEFRENLSSGTPMDCGRDCLQRVYARLLAMSANEILSLIDAEIASLQQARALIAGAIPKNSPGRPKSTAVSAVKPKKKWKLSAEAREKIAEGQRKRWAAQKKAAK
jgi:hypothetical protein